MDESGSERARPRRSKKRNLNKIGGDLLAGVTGTIASIPDAMASAAIAGVSPAHGLYSFIFGTPIAALASSSVLVCVTTTSALSLLTKSALNQVPASQAGQALVLLVMLAGLLQFIFGLLRLGFLTYFVSNAVMTGFLTGIALRILMGAAPDLAGYESTAQHNLFKFIDFLGHFHQVNLSVLAISSVTIGSLFIFDRSRLKKFSPLLALAIATTAVAVFHLESIPSIGSTYPVPNSLPEFFVPDLSMTKDLLLPAFAIASIGLIQAAGVSQSNPNPGGDYPSISKDFAAQGLGNLTSGLFSGLPIGGSLSATALMRGAGAQSRWANVSIGGLMAIAFLSLSPIINRLPVVAIDGLLFVFVARSLKPRQVVSVWRTSWSARTTMLASMGMTIFLNLQIAVVLGIGFSVLLHLLKSSHQVKIVQLRWDTKGILEEPAPSELESHKIIVLSTYGSLFFAGARIFENRLPSPDRSDGAVVILGIRGREEIGSTFIGAICRYAERLRSHRGELILAGVDDQIMIQLERTRAIDILGRQNVIPSSRRIGESLARALDRARTLTTWSRA